MKKQKTYNYYKKYLKTQFKLGYSQLTASKNLSVRFNVSEKYAESISFLFYNKFLDSLKRSEWPIVNLY